MASDDSVVMIVFTVGKQLDKLNVLSRYHRFAAYCGALASKGASCFAALAISSKLIP